MRLTIFMDFVEKFDLKEISEFCHFLKNKNFKRQIVLLTLALFYRVFRSFIVYCVFNFWTKHFVFKFFMLFL